MTVNRFSEFFPHPLLRGAHAQTLLSFYVQTTRYPYQATRHTVELDDGDTLLLHDDRPVHWKDGDRIVLMLPGLLGCHQSPMMRRLTSKLNSRGYRTVRMDLRGCGAGSHLAEQPGHAGRSEDAAAAVQRIHETCPQSPVTAVGISMGGNIVLKMLGDTRPYPLGNLDSAVAVAPPIDLLACSLNMLRPANWIYSWSFVRALHKQVKRRRPFVEAMQQIPLRPRPRNLLEFDDRFTAPLSGFRDARDYYAQCSSGPLLSGIDVPTLIIAAADDPLIPVSIFEEARYSTSTNLVITERGGHVGFLGKSGVDPDRRWLDWRIVEWISWHDSRRFETESCGINSTSLHGA